MSGALIVVLPFLAVIGGLLVLLLLVPRRRRQVAIDERTYPGLRDLRAKTGRARTLGLCLGVAAAWAMATARTPWATGGRGIMLAPVVFGIVVIAVVTVGDLLAHGDARSSSLRRSAAVTPAGRGLSDATPRGLPAAVLAVTAALLVTLAVGWILGAPDVTGPRPGSSLGWESPDGMFGGGSGPWPGPYYGRVALPALLVLSVVLALAVTVTSRRPADGSDPEITRVDSIIRRRELETLVAAAGLSVCTLTAGVAAVAASALHGIRMGARLNGYDPGVWYDVGGGTALALAMAALAVGIRCAVCLLVPGPAARRGPRSAVVAPRKVIA